MKNRRDFLAALSATGASLALAAGADAQTPAATASPAPSSVALASAKAMRRFDPHLSDAEVDTIARAIDDNAKAANALNPKKKRLKNSDEPVATFVVPFP